MKKCYYCDEETDDYIYGEEGVVCLNCINEENYDEGF